RERRCRLAHCKRRSQRRQVVASPHAIKRRTRTHAVFTKTSPVFHESTAEIAMRKSPSLREIGDAVVNIGLRAREFSGGAVKTEHGGSRWPHLHQADLAQFADRMPMPGAFDLNDSIGNSGRQSRDPSL